MRLRLCLTILSVILSCLSVVANTKIDSIQNLLNRPGLTANDSMVLLGELGYEYWTVDPRQSIIHGRQSLEVAVKLNDRERTAFAYRVIGVAYWALGDYPIALQNMLESLKLYQEMNNLSGIGSMQMNIGLVYSDQAAYAEAKRYFRAGKRIFEKLGERGRAATSNTKIATILTQEDSLDLAKEYLFQAIDIHRAQNFSYGLAEAYNRMGIVYRESGDLEAALDYLYRSRDRSKSIEDHEGLAKCFSDIGFTEFERGQYQQALFNFKQSAAMARKIGSKKWKLEAYAGLAATHEQMGNLPLALRFYKRYQALHDTILNEEKMMAVANLQEEYRSREQLRNLELTRQQVTSLQAQARNKNLLLWLFATGILLTLGVLVLGYRNYRLKLRETDLEQERQAEIMRLKNEKQKTAIENSRLKQEELKRELELSQRELASYALNFLQKNEFLEELKSDLEALKSTREIVRIKHKIHQAKTLDKDWEKFRLQFEKVHTGFFNSLKQKHSGLTPSELKHCSLIRINLNIKECAAILGISPDSAKTARHRIRKKLNLSPGDSILDYLSSFGK